MFKTIILCYLAVAIVSTEGPPGAPPGPPPGLDECKQKTGATNADLEEFRSHGVPTTDTAACLMGCMGKKIGMLSADNSFNLDKALDMVSYMEKNPPPNAPTEIASKMKQMFTTCKQMEGTTPPKSECTAAKNMAQCLSDQRKALGIPEMRPPPRS